MYDIVTFGSATSDIFVKLLKENFEALYGKNNSELLCLALGSKTFIEQAELHSGGGGTNVACAFSIQGFKVAYCGKIGNDMAGEAVISDLKKHKVETRYCFLDKDMPTAFSIILSVPEKERTILFAKGACHTIKEEEIPFSKLKNSKWFYAAPLSGSSSLILRAITEFAKKNSIKTALNLGIFHIESGEDSVKDLIAGADVLFLNNEELKKLFGNLQETDEDLMKKLFKISNSLIVVTKGKEGSLIYNGEYFWQSPSINIDVKEKTGAGDAYCSGFLSEFIRTGDIEKSIQLATFNAASCIKRIGAKEGLLKKGEDGGFEKVQVKKYK